MSTLAWITVGGVAMSVLALSGSLTLLTLTFAAGIAVLLLIAIGL